MNSGTNNVWMQNANFGYYPFMPIQERQNEPRFIFRPVIVSKQVYNNMLSNIASIHQNYNSASDVEEIVPDFPCRICSERFLTYTEFQTHLETHKKYDDKFSSVQNKLLEAFGRSAWKKPIGKSALGGKKYHCPQCNQFFKYRSSLAEHFAHHSKGFFCAFCNSKFSSGSSLQKHFAMQHSTGKNRRHCSYCNYTCYQHSDLEKHISRRHTRDFKFKCSFCEKGFVTPKELYNHLRRKHSGCEIIAA